MCIGGHHCTPHKGIEEFSTGGPTPPCAPSDEISGRNLPVRAETNLGMVGAGGLSDWLGVGGRPLSVNLVVSTAPLSFD